MSIPLVVYHAGCMDGAGAALAAYQIYKEDAEYRPTRYGDAIPTDNEVRDREVFVLDFSYPREELIRINKVARILRVIDHHKTAKEDLEGLDFCRFDMDHSGAVLAWKYIVGLGDTKNVFLPPVIQYIEDRDLWKWELPMSREISAALAATGALSDFRKLIPYLNWEKQGDGSRTLKRALQQDGTAILSAEKGMVSRITKIAEPVMLCGHRIMVAMTPVLQSEVGEALATESINQGGSGIGACCFRDGRTKEWIVSLRSRSDGQTKAPDVSNIARNFGGGGHAQAAGFRCQHLPWSSLVLKAQ